MSGIERIANMHMGNAHGPDPEHIRTPAQQKTLAILAGRSDDPIKAYGILREYSSKATTVQERAEFNANIRAFFGNGAAKGPYSVDSLVTTLEGRPQPHKEPEAGLEEDEDPFREFGPITTDYRDLIGGIGGRNPPKVVDHPEEAPVVHYEHPLKA